jgi:hypothetical protein
MYSVQDFHLDLKHLCGEVNENVAKFCAVNRTAMCKVTSIKIVRLETNQTIHFSTAGAQDIAQSNGQLRSNLDAIFFVLSAWKKISY